jgi:hypothetical protein
LHPVAEPVGESKLLADDGHQPVGLVGMKIVAGREQDRKTKTGDGNNSVSDSINGNQRGLFEGSKTGCARPFLRPPASGIVSYTEIGALPIIEIQTGRRSPTSSPFWLDPQRQAFMFELLETRQMLSTVPAASEVVSHTLETSAIVQKSKVSFGTTLIADLRATLATDKGNYVAFKTFLVNHDDALGTALKPMVQPYRAILMMLRDTITLCPTEITDNNLYNAAHGLAKHGITEPFNKPVFLNNINYIEQLPPQMAASFLHMIAVPIYSDNDTMTWASESWACCLNDAQLAKVASSSAVAKLLNENGLITIPTVTYAEFQWSGWPDEAIKLTPVVWTSKDVPNLTRMLNNPNYSAFASTALAQIRAGNMTA